MKTLLAAAMIAIVGLAPAPLAASGTGRTARNDAPTAPANLARNTGSASAALQGYTTSGPDRDCPTAEVDTSTTAPNPSRNTGTASATGTQRAASPATVARRGPTRPRRRTPTKTPA